LGSSRKKYKALLKEKSRAPDVKYGGWNAPLKNSTQSGEGGSTDLDLVNPLSLHNEVGTYHVIFELITLLKSSLN